MLLRKQEVNILRYLPGFLSKDEKFKNTANVCSAEHERLRLLLDDILKQFFIMTATWGLSYWERVFEITMAHSDSYEIRRNRILLRLQSTQTSTKKFMTELINRYTKSGSGFLVERNNEYAIEIGIREDDIVSWDELVNAIDTYKPAHLTSLWRLGFSLPKIKINHEVQLTLNHHTDHYFWGNRRRYYPLDGCVLLDGSITLGDWMALQQLNGGFLLDGTSLLDGYTQYGTNEHHRVRFKMHHIIGSKITPSMEPATNIKFSASSGIMLKSSATFHVIRNCRYSIPIEIRNDIGFKTNHRVKMVLRHKASNQYIDGKSRLDGHLRLDGQELHDSILFKSITNKKERNEIL